MIIDPARNVRNVLKERLEFENFEVDAFETLEQGYHACSESSYEILLVDGVLGDDHVSSGRRGIFGYMSPIILSSNPSIETAVHAIREGAYDFVSKPVDMNQLLAAIRNVLAIREAEEWHFSTKPRSPEVAGRATSGALAPAHNDEEGDDGSIIGTSDPIVRVKALIDRVGPSDARVLITGPNGVGKELVARWLHRKSTRRSGPFVEVNCAAIPSELIESELFGHEKGAFTSAVKQRKGKFEQADGGTLFLDEIGDMSLSAQSKVLRALQEHRIARVGGDRDIDVDVRIVSATNKNLLKEIALGNFREDLYHRLSVIIIHVPPLVERLGDIPLLVNYFVKKICNEYGMAPKALDAGAVAELQKMDWTGNIRELRNVVERLIILSDKTITTEDVKLYATPMTVN
jgi:DNA-binding NtrC family response regulator